MIYFFYKMYYVVNIHVLVTYFYVVNINCFFQQSDLSQASIFTGEEELFAFDRTISRLTEMQTEEYWAHRDPTKNS